MAGFRAPPSVAVVPGLSDPGPEAASRYLAQERDLEILGQPHRLGPPGDENQGEDGDGGPGKHPDEAVDQGAGLGAGQVVENHLYQLTRTR